MIFYAYLQLINQSYRRTQITMNFGSLSSSIFGGSYQLQSTAVDSIYQSQTSTQNSLTSSSIEIMSQHVGNLIRSIDFCMKLFDDSRKNLQHYGPQHFSTLFTPQYMTKQMYNLNDRAQAILQFYSHLQQPQEIQLVRRLTIKLFIVNQHAFRWLRYHWICSNKSTSSDKNKIIAREDSEKSSPDKILSQYDLLNKYQSNKNNQYGKIKTKDAQKESSGGKSIQKQNLKNRYQVSSKNIFKSLFQELKALEAFIKNTENEKNIQEMEKKYKNAQIRRGDLFYRFQNEEKKYFQTQIDQRSYQDFSDHQLKIKQLQKEVRDKLARLKARIYVKRNKDAKSSPKMYDRR